MTVSLEEGWVMEVTMELSVADAEIFIAMTMCLELPL
jgi:hypothetical protein